MSAITFRAPFGIAGDVSRNFGNNTIEPQPYGATSLLGYGIAVKLTAGLIVPLSGSGDVVYGFLVRPFPTTGANASDPLAAAVPPPAPTTAVSGAIQAPGPLNILTRGYLSVFVQEGAGSVAAGGAVYARYAASGQLLIGGIGGASIGSNNFAVSGANVRFGGAYFTGPADASGFAEIAFNI